MAKLDIIIKKRYKTCPHSENKYIKGKDLIMSKLDKDQVIADFTEAYKAKNGKKPEVEAKGGWYSVDGGKNMRLADLEAMTAEISGTAAPAKKSEKDADKPKKEAKKSKKAEDKKPAVKKKSASKKKTKKKAKSSDFSVKDFWAKKITEQNSGAKLPR